MSLVTMTYNSIDLSDYFEYITDIRRDAGNDDEIILYPSDTRGTKLLKINRGPKIIEVDFTIYTRNRSSVKRALAGIFAVDEEKKITFSDEPDIYYLGIKQGIITIRDTSGGRSTGTITLYVPDGVAHAVNENSKTFTSPIIEHLTPAKLPIPNKGTAETFPVIEAMFREDCGWVSFVNDTGVISIGSRDAVDMDDLQPKEIVVQNMHVFRLGGHTVGASTSPIPVPTTLQYDNVGTEAFPQAGPTWEELPPAIYGPTDPGAMFTPAGGRETTIPTGDLATGDLQFDQNGIATLKTKGAVGDGKKWCGGYYAVTPQLGSNGGGVGNKRFYSIFQLTAETSKATQTGILKVLFLDKNNRIIACFMIAKTDPVNNRAEFAFYYGGNSIRKYKSFSFIPSNSRKDNVFRAGASGSVDFEKQGGRLRFNYQGRTHSIYVPELAEVEVAKMGVYIGQWGNRSMSADQYFYMLRVKHFHAENQNVDKMKGIKNLFSRGDVLRIETSSGNVYLNGIRRNDIVAKDSDFLYLPPGPSDLLVYWSAWTQTGPNVRIRMREAYL